MAIGLRIARGATASVELATIFACRAGVLRISTNPLPSRTTRGRASRYSVLVGAYNTKLVVVANVRNDIRISSIPRGNLGIEADDAHWFATIVTLREHVGFDLFRAIASRNGVSMRKGQAVLAARVHVVTNRRHGGWPADLSVSFVDPSKYLDERDKWTRLFKDVFVEWDR